MINFFHNAPHLEGSPCASVLANAVESNVFVAHLIELESPDHNELDLTPVRANSANPSRRRCREPSLGGSGAHELYVMPAKKAGKRQQRSETEERSGTKTPSRWTNQMAKCLENVSLNKATLRQYQELYSDIEVPFSPLDNLASIRIEDQENRDTLATNLKRLRLISSSYRIPIQTHTVPQLGMPIGMTTLHQSSIEGIPTRLNSTHRMACADGATMSQH